MRKVVFKFVIFTGLAHLIIDSTCHYYGSYAINIRNLHTCRIKVKCINSHFLQLNEVLKYLIARDVISSFFVAGSLYHMYKDLRPELKPKPVNEQLLTST